MNINDADRHIVITRNHPTLKFGQTGIACNNAFTLDGDICHAYPISKNNVFPAKHVHDYKRFNAALSRNNAW